MSVLRTSRRGVRRSGAVRVRCHARRLSAQPAFADRRRNLASTVRSGFRTAPPSRGVHLEANSWQLRVSKIAIQRKARRLGSIPQDTSTKHSFFGLSKSMSLYPDGVRDYVTYETSVMILASRWKEEGGTARFVTRCWPPAIANNLSGYRDGR